MKVEPSRARSLHLLDRSTPCFLPPTVCANLPLLTPDNSKHVQDASARVVNFADIYTFADAVSKSPAAELRKLLQLHDTTVILSAQDYFSKASTSTSSKSGFSINTTKGRHVVAPSEYMSVAASLQSDLTIALADEVDLSYGKNRHRKAVDISLKWLDECLQSIDASTPKVAGVIVGGQDEKLRRYSASETSKRDVGAVILSGLDDVESDQERLQLAQACVEEVESTSIPRLISGIGHPLQILQSVAVGIDAFVTTYPYELTKGGSALIPWINDDDVSSVRSADRKQFGSVLHLRESVFADDMRPIQDGCACPACTSYSRAYIHHLLDVREMLGDVLLNLHNLSQYSRFFQAIRDHISSDTFAHFSQTFIDAYHERPSTAPPIAIPLAILEKQKEKEEAKQKDKKVKDNMI